MILWTRAENPLATLVLAHGAGAPMDSAFMTKIATALAARGISVARFEFPYMAARRTSDRRPPPPKAESLVPAFRAALNLVLADQDGPSDGPMFVGGKSMGGRIATMLTGGPVDARVRGVVCFGYPLHPPGKPETMRLGPLEGTRLPTLVCQGERDEFGNRATFETLALQKHIAIEWIPDGNHDFGPRGASGATLSTNIAAAATAAASFMATVLSPPVEDTDDVAADGDTTDGYDGDDDI